MSVGELLGPHLDAYNCAAIKSCRVDELPNGEAPFVLEPKYDGFRLITHITRGGVESWTRSLKPQAGKIPYVDEELLKLFPTGTVLDGEIVALQYFEDPDTKSLRVVNDFEHVQSVMLSKPERAVRKARETRPLDYMVFDCTYFDGMDVRSHPWAQRRRLLDEAFNGAAMNWTPQRVGMTRVWKAEQHVHDSLVSFGFEGTIAKSVEGPYRSGKRGHGWYKLKVQDEVDAVVVDIKPGTPGSAFDGMVGALYFGQPWNGKALPDDVEIKTIPGDTMKTRYVVRGSCSGITFTERQRLTKLWKDKPDELIGRVMSFKHMGKYPDGVKFRHPQFGRWRDDKPRSEVVWDG